MRKYLLIIAILISAVCQTHAYQFKYTRSLNAASTPTTGISFDGVSTYTISGITYTSPLPPIGGGETWNVLLSATGNANMTFQIQVQLADGSTWIPLMTESVVASAAGSSMYYNFLGPFANMRVVTTAVGAGSLTADIFVLF